MDVNYPLLSIVLLGAGTAAYIWFTLNNELEKVFVKKQLIADEFSVREKLKHLADEPSEVSPVEGSGWLREGSGYAEKLESEVDRNTFNTLLSKAGRELGGNLQRRLKDVAHSICKHWKAVIACLIVVAMVISASRMAALTDFGVPLELIFASWLDFLILIGPTQTIACVSAILIGIFLAWFIWVLLYSLLESRSVRCVAFVADKLRPSYLSWIWTLCLFIPGIYVAHSVYFESNIDRDITPADVRSVRFDGQNYTGVVEAITSKALVLRGAPCRPDKKKSYRNDVYLLTLNYVSSLGPCLDQIVAGSWSEGQATSVVAVMPMAGSDEDFARVVLGCDLVVPSNMEVEIPPNPPTALFPTNVYRIEDMEDNDRIKFFSELSTWFSALGNQDDLSKLRIAIVGFASPSGTSAANLELATKRADAVKREFEKSANTRGIRFGESIVRAVGLGETVPYRRFLDSEKRQQSASVFICQAPPEA